MAGELTLLLREASAGDQPALDRLVALLYVELRQLAHRCRRHGPGEMATTSLVHECYLRFVRAGDLALNDRAHFFNLAARIMRQLLCDYARECLAVKRGGEVEHVPLRDDDAAELAEAEQCLAIDEALTRLQALRPDQAKVVECRFYAGLTEEETAEATGRSLRSVQRDWQAARQWLAGQLD